MCVPYINLSVQQAIIESLLSMGMQQWRWQRLYPLWFVVQWGYSKEQLQYHMKYDTEWTSTQY